MKIKNTITKTKKNCKRGRRRRASSRRRAERAGGIHQLREQLDDEAFSGPFAMQLPADVWLLHNPLFGFCDVLPDGKSVGSKMLRELWDMEAERPRLVASGHIHEAFSVVEQGGTTFVNAGPLFEKRAARIRLSEDAVEVELVKG